MSTELPAGIYPFWFWNDRLKKKEIKWQIAQMAKQRIRGFYIHPRQGLGQPYLSDAFFEMVDTALAAADENDITVHLYDEYPYPSGTAGGEVVMGEPEFHATKLYQNAWDVAGGKTRLELPPGRVLSAQAYPMENGQIDWGNKLDLMTCIGTVLSRESYVETGLTAYNRKRYFASDPSPVLETTLPSSPHRIFITIQVEVRGHKYWDHFADVMNPKAVKKFLEFTHQRYGSRYTNLFGSEIQSVFVDETAPRWSTRIPPIFEQRYGYDIRDNFPASQDPSHPDHLQVKNDLQNILFDTFCKSFEKTVSNWCAQNDLLYAGEKPSTRMSQLQWMDIPGGDPGHFKAGSAPDILKARPRQNARTLASAAYFYGKPGALAECYHSLGWGGTLQDAKIIGESLLWAGIRYLVPHGFFYSTHALRKHDAPPSFFFQMPYWKHFGRLAERFENILSRFEDTHIDAGILVVEPSPHQPTEEDKRTYEQIINSLVEQHFDFLMADTDILQSGSVEEGLFK
ncbi:MAG: glycoside hydrolase, partial [Planctomycetes bacterium]|nr:glycoside hydrolase [Planctomycetota bacterium]